MVTETERKTISLNDLIDAYLSSRSHLSPSTRRYLGTCLKNLRWYAAEFDWPTPAGDITRDHVRQFLNYVSSTRRRWGLTDPTRSSERRAAPATVNHYGKVIKRLFRWASDEEEYLPDNGIWRLRLPAPHYHLVEPYTDDEVMAMLEACEDTYRFSSRFLGSRNQAIIAMFADTGVRLGELAGIRLGDLHSSLKQVRVTGKGAKVRAVPLQGQSMKALNRYLLHRPEEATDWLWLAEEGGPISAEAITSMVERLKKETGVSSPGLVHRFRHYYATRYLEAGGNANSLRLLLGHESFAMVLHYTRMVSAQRAIDEHEKFSPLNHLYKAHNRNHDNDGWGWHGNRH
ncbi:Tyrosine recombinase XerC [subsurface metagenome]